ncbi:sugar transferase [Azospirillum rugosum]|uniref:Lipopolysaccharide/colanic/teichoic acid biosynthesis glycosyltransferase n=1 Tax=Azospirillum rugosum TaxID=416170 RepID=A0ABS4SJ66_9PROT|nr:sugar transferase [Azospirillum rugosum]MBP2291430.1 lipopolysaccharide/colanic/teichoic acid biosynthesis glycosyltransferase [Azospirillum rugosum]MDQ0525218.1 lipopolysaccharide/colanic/teichoic acid biosynthesis glycosyltransferase [Azospirillum rugosum]
MPNADEQRIDLKVAADHPFARDYGESRKGLQGGAIAPTTGRLFVNTALILSDAASFVAALSLVKTGFSGYVDPDMLTRTIALIAVVLVILFSCASLYPGYRLYDHEHLSRRLKIIFDVGIVSFLIFAVALGDWPTAFAIVGFLVLASIVQPILRSAVRALLHQAGCWGEGTALIAGPQLTPVLREYFQKNWQYGVNPLPWTLAHRWPLNAAGDAPHPSWYRKPDVVLVAPDQIARFDDFDAVRRDYRDVIVLADTPHIKISGLQPCQVGGHIGLRIGASPEGRPRKLLRRAIDVMIALPAILLFAPALLIAGFAIWMVDPGPVIYRQARVGLAGRTLHIVKLRTMYRDADERLRQLLEADEAARREWSSYFKLKNDPRILPYVGRLLRATSLDELPQLINVLLGDMSIVGPRPFPEYHLNAMPAEFRSKRCTVSPGLTGLWQISDRSSADVETAQRLDSFYIDNRTVAFDWMIIIKTALAVIRCKGT